MPPINDLADFLEEVGESNFEWNNSQRHIISDIEEKNGGCWLGNINIYDSNRDKPVMWQWDEGFVYNFECSFVVPKYDEELERLILERDKTPYTCTSDDLVLVKAITDRVFEIGGRCLMWS
jgi:hypothetical protein